METIYSRTDGWPSFACWQVACCQHFRLLSYREQQFRILIGTQKDILYSFFLGIYRHRKRYKRKWQGGKKADDYVWFKCKSGEFVHVDFSVQISWWEYKNGEAERGQKSTDSMHQVFPGSSDPHASASCCSNNKQFIKARRIHSVSSYAEHLEEICENREVSGWSCFFFFPLWFRCSLYWAGSSWNHVLWGSKTVITYQVLVLAGRTHNKICRSFQIARFARVLLISLWLCYLRILFYHI